MSTHLQTEPRAVAAMASQREQAGLHWSDPGPVALTRCSVLRGGRDPQRRYVRQADFGLWRHLMESRHGMTIVPERTSHWLSDQLAPFEPDFEVGVCEPLVRLCGVIWGPGGMPMALERYLPSEDLEPAQTALLAHYADRLEVHSLTLIPGYFMPSGEEDEEVTIV